jgi:hypothetical protein
MEHKRKREGGPEGAPVAKKPALALDARTQERLRGETAALYARYKALCDAPDGGSDDAAFQALLDAAQGAARARRAAARRLPPAARRPPPAARRTPPAPRGTPRRAPRAAAQHGGPSVPAGRAAPRPGPPPARRADPRRSPPNPAAAPPPAGGCAARRLAARLIPRFLARHPAAADTAAALLADLHEGRRAGVGGGGRSGATGPDPLSAPALEEAARRDALAGLAAVLDAAAALEPARADAAVARVLDHLTR